MQKRKLGKSGLEVSDLLPQLARHADKLCVLRAVHTDNPNHGPALFLMNNGSMTPTRPCAPCTRSGIRTRCAHRCVPWSARACARITACA